MWRELADILLPRACLVCGCVLGMQEQHLCIRCAADLPLTYYWERVHNPMADEFNAVLERHRGSEETLPYVQAAALTFYHHENPYKLIPRALKYQGNIAAGQYYGALLGRYMAGVAHWRNVDMVVPVPLHWRRQWERGYNQAEVIAGSVARELGAALCTRLLYRASHTSTQTRLDADARLRNVENVFRVRDGPSCSPRHILLIDDTFTTGATLAACHKALRSALGHSVQISVATLAVVQD